MYYSIKKCYRNLLTLCVLCITFVVATLLLSSNVFAQEAGGEWHDDVLRIKVESGAAEQMDISVQDDVALTGIQSLDQLNAEMSAINIERVFSHGGEYEERRRAHGLHQWYEIEFETGAVTSAADVNEVARHYGADPNVETAEGKAVAETFTDEQQLIAPPDDPLYEDQWGFNNTGQTGGTAGADINAEAGWQIQTGDTTVVVSIHDSGIDLDHDDVFPNIWYNPDHDPDDESIHGRNFGTGAPDDIQDIDGHGTHVTGTVAAVTNNDEGVAGTAGGDGLYENGRGTGTRYMVTTPIGEEDSYAYAADNGALISQNSWGYTNPGDFPQVMEDAIDYFIEEAGHDEDGNPDPDAHINGGIVVFAAGNSNTDEEYFPAAYDPVVAVAATDHNDERATGWFGGQGSTYGEQIDISAPGDNIWSTVPGNGYDNFNGTSMAAPHVSGAAALVIAEFDDMSTPEQVMDHLYDTADDIDDQNPDYEGLLGEGRLNIGTALQEDDGEAPEAITDLDVTDVSPAIVDLQWTAPEGPASLYDLRYSTEPIEDDNDFENAEQYPDTPGGSQPGETEEVEVTGLTPGTEYYFAVKSEDTFGNRSDMSNVVSATTDEGPVVAVDPEEVFKTLDVGDSGSDIFSILNEGAGELGFELGVSYSGSEVSDPIAETGTTSSAEYPKRDEELSTGPAPEDLEGVEDYHQPRLNQSEIDDAIYWGVLSTGVGENDFGYFEGSDPSDFNVVGDYPGTEFSNAGDFPADDDSYVYELDNMGNLRTIDVTDGSVEELGSIGSDWTGMATDPIDGTMYISTGTDLYTLDVANMETEQIGSFGIDFMIALAIDGNGTMYGYSVETNAMYTIDKATAEITELGDIGFDANFGQGMTWDSENDEIVLSAFNNTTSQSELRIADRETGNTDYIGDLADQMGWIATPIQPASEWLSVSPVEGNLEPDGSMDIDMMFETTFEEADDLIGGMDYLGEVVIASNDPGNPEMTLPVTLTVEGDPEISLSDEVLDFGDVFAGTSTMEYLTISNDGDAVLQIGELSVDNDVFDVYSDQFNLNPGESMEVPMSFSPDDSESFEGTLTIVSNVGDVEVELVGEGVPFVSIDPDELEQEIDLTSGDTTATQTFTVTNEFDESLPFSVFIESLEGESSEFFPGLVDEELVRWQEMVSMDYPEAEWDEITMEAAPESRELDGEGNIRGFAELMDELDVIGYGNDPLGDVIASFDLGVPEELTILDASVDSYAGNFAFGDNDHIYWIENETNMLYTYSLEDGSVEEVGELEPEATSEGWTDMETDFTDGTSYVTTYDDAAATNRLYEIDVDNAELHHIGDFHDGLNIAFAIDDEGNAYGHSITDNVVLSVDLETAEYEVIGSTGIDANFAQSMTYDHETDQLLMASYHGPIFGEQGELRYVDRETGNTLPVGLFGGTGDHEITWFATEGEGIQWLSTNLEMGVIPAGASLDLQANFDASELIEGDYEAQITIRGDELQGEPSEALPAFLEVIGEPDLVLSKEQLDFGEVFANGESAPQMVTVINEGTADVELDVSVGEGFTLEGPEEITLEPDQSEVFEVTFAPDEVTEYEATLSFDGDRDDAEVTLTGEGIPAPEIAVDPEGFEKQAYIGQEQEYTLEVSNEWADTLEYEAVIGDDPFADDMGDDLDLILEEDFDVPEADFPPEDWSRAGANDGENWTTECFGRPDELLPAAVFCWSPSTDGMQRLISPQISTAAYGEIVVAFEHEVNNFGSEDDFEIRLESSADGGQTWTTVTEFPAADVPPTQEMITVDNDDVGSDEFHLAWTFEGDSFNINEWGFTDLAVYGEINWLTVSPEEGALEGDETLEHTLSVDASGLEEGTHELGVLLNSNDPVTPTEFVPFTLHVIEALSVTADVAEENEEVWPTEEFTVPITVESMDDLEVMSYQFELEFDADVLEITDVDTANTLTEDAYFEYNIEDGQVSVAAADEPEGLNAEDQSDLPSFMQIEGEGTLVYITFKAQEIHDHTDITFGEMMFNEGEPPASTYDGEVEVKPKYGDVDMNLSVNAFDATMVLQYAVGSTDFNDIQLIHGNVSGGDNVTAFDASLILQYVTGMINWFPVEEDLVAGQEDDGQGDTEAQTISDEITSGGGEISFGDLEQGEEANLYSLPITLSQAETVHSVQLALDIEDVDVDVEDLRADLPDGWIKDHNVSDGELAVAMAGTEPISSGELGRLLLEFEDLQGQATINSEVRINDNELESLELELGEVPDEFELSQNYPNPFNPATTIEYSLPEAVDVQLTVYNALGQEVTTLVDGEQEAGSYEVQWDASGVSSGMYIYRLQAGDFIESHSMIFMK